MWVYVGVWVHVGVYDTLSVWVHVGVYNTLSAATVDVDVGVCGCMWV